MFENSPIPLASVDARGFVRVANRAFLAFVGHADPTGILLSRPRSSTSTRPCSTTCSWSAGDGSTIKQLIEIPHRGGYVVETVVILTPAPETRLVTPATSTWRSTRWPRAPCAAPDPPPVQNDEHDAEVDVELEAEVRLDAAGARDSRRAP